MKISAVTAMLNETLPYIYTLFVQCFTKFGMQYDHNLLSENRHSENNTFLKGHNQTFALPSIFVVLFG